MKKETSHYRNVFKSDHLSSADLEDLLEAGKELKFTISHVKQEFGARVAGKKIDANIAYFKEDIKPLVLNATNSDIVRSFVDSNQVDNWRDIPIELYVKKDVSFAGQKVRGVRIKRSQPKVEKPLVNETRFKDLLNSIKAGTYTKEKALATLDLTDEQKAQL